MADEFVRVKKERYWEGIGNDQTVPLEEERDLEDNARGQYWCVKIERVEECASQLSSEVNVKEESMKEREQECGNKEVCVREERDLEGNARGSFWCVKIEKDGECSPNKLSSSINVREECVKEREQECGNNNLCMKEDSFFNVHVKIERELDYDSGFVKHELVVEPEQLQMQDVAFEIQVNNTNASNKVDAEINWVATGAGNSEEEGQNHSKSNAKEFGVKNCTVISDRSYSTYKPQKIRKKKTLETHYECDACGKRFAKKSNMSLHVRIHMRDIQYTCDVCKKQFFYYYNLKRHMRIHTGEKPHRCDVCDRRFTDPCNLASHIKRIHSRTRSTETHEERKYSCKICNKLFPSPSHLKSHKRVHTGEKPYPCNLCDKQFASASNLKRHKRGHTGEKPYSCDKCNEQFMEIYSYTKHIHNHMGVVPIYPCDICKKQFKDPRTRARHKQIHKGETFTCEICNKTYLSVHTFNNHKGYHKLKAEKRDKDRNHKETK